jgi:hypothetical protein
VGAITADQVGGKDLANATTVEALSGRQHAVIALHEINDPRAVKEGKSGRRGGVRKQHRFQVDLVDTMGRLGCRPPCVGAPARGITLGAARNQDARKLHPDRGSAKHNIVRIMGGKAGIAHGSDHPEATKNLHSACRDMVAFHAGRFAGCAYLSDHHLDAALREIDS